MVSLSVDNCWLLLLLFLLFLVSTNARQTKDLGSELVRCVGVERQRVAPTHLGSMLLLFGLLLLQLVLLLLLCFWLLLLLLLCACAFAQFVLLLFLIHWFDFLFFFLLAARLLAVCSGYVFFFFVLFWDCRWITVAGIRYDTAATELHCPHSNQAALCRIYSYMCISNITICKCRTDRIRSLKLTLALTGSRTYCPMGILLQSELLNRYGYRSRCMIVIMIAMATARRRSNSRDYCCLLRNQTNRKRYDPTPTAWYDWLKAVIWAELSCAEGPGTSMTARHAHTLLHRTHTLR